jgi:hypothetical protein
MKVTKLTELKIDERDLRLQAVAILAHSGYIVAIEERKSDISPYKKEYYVIVMLDETP